MVYLTTMFSRTFFLLVPRKRPQDTFLSRGHEAVRASAVVHVLLGTIWLLFYFKVTPGPASIYFLPLTKTPLGEAAGKGSCVSEFPWGYVRVPSPPTSPPLFPGERGRRPGWWSERACCPSSPGGLAMWSQSKPHV